QSSPFFVVFAATSTLRATVQRRSHIRRRSSYDTVVSNDDGCSCDGEDRETVGGERERERETERKTRGGERMKDGV
ncbi:Hypothetical predicted protein, partial [Olea europaea subsp. europaea]